MNMVDMGKVLKMFGIDLGAIDPQLVMRQLGEFCQQVKARQDALEQSHLELHRKLDILLDVHDHQNEQVKLEASASPIRRIV